MAAEVHHAAGTTLHHKPGDGTKPYLGVVSGEDAQTLTITYVVEGEPVHRIYTWLDIGQRWFRGPGAWQRRYFDDGTYTVTEGPYVRETGTYTTS
jgi:hypothetical protein